MKKYLIVIAFTLAIGIPNANAQFALPGDNPGTNSYTGAGTPTPNTIAAQGNSGGININYIKPYSDSIIGIINIILVPVLIAIAFIVFLWGVYKYFIYHGDSESDKMEGRKYAMWGIIGLVVIFSVWALVNILMGALNLSGGKPPPIPKI